jgi:hypothetical protein
MALQSGTQTEHTNDQDGHFRPPEWGAFFMVYPEDAYIWRSKSPTGPAKWGPQRKGHCCESSVKKAADKYPDEKIRNRVPSAYCDVSSQ